MKRVIVTVIAVALASYGLGHYVGKESLRPRLMLVEHTLETVAEKLHQAEQANQYKIYAINKCVVEYHGLTGEILRFSLEEYLSLNKANITDLGEKDFHGDDNQMELEI